MDLDQVLSSCVFSIYALRVLRSHGLCPQLLNRVAKTTTVASLMYVAPAWWGFSSARDQARIEQLINKLKHSGFLPQSASAALDLACDADACLFRAVIIYPEI